MMVRVSRTNPIGAQRDVLFACEGFLREMFEQAARRSPRLQIEIAWRARWPIPAMGT